MKKTIGIILTAVILVVLVVLGCNMRQQNKSRELLHITALAYENGENFDNGVDMVTYVYDVEKKTVEQLARIPSGAVYPISYYDYKDKLLYYSNGKEGDGYDNLYQYDMEKKTNTQLTDGKFVFNDIIWRDGNLICNVAPQFSTVTKPAIYNIQDNTFQYLDEEDDDTWCHSLSYNKSTDALISLTCSDKEMRTAKVCEETFIRPKKICILSPDFQFYEPVYATDTFEIRSARQLDEEHIMIAADPRMGWEYTDRKLKTVDIKTQEVTDLDIIDLQAIQSFYPRDNAKGVYILGQDLSGKVSIFYYQLDSGECSDILEGYEFSDDFCSIVDFIYSDN